MKHNKILILGGYGNAGLAITRLLMGQMKIGIILAGRNGKRAQTMAENLNREFNTDCVWGIEVNAASKESLVKAFQQVDLVVVAASTIEYTHNVAEAALETGIDYFDIQIATKSKHKALDQLRERILQSGCCFITDGGYRPGIPAAMVRYAATQIPGLVTAPVASVFQINWKQREFAASSAAEFVDELQSFSQLFLSNGEWKRGSMNEFVPIDFGSPFGKKYCMPMFMEEFRSLPEFIPTLKNTGFYSAGFGGAIDYVIIPLAFLLLVLFPNRSRGLIARLIEWGLKNTTHPPYGAVLQMNARGEGGALTMTVKHDDSYVITAAPAVACLLQYFNGTLRKPGLWWQAALVEPVCFFEDLAQMGVNVTVENTPAGL